MTGMTAAITGAGSGNGRRVVQCLREAGWNVALTGCNAGKPTDTAAGAGEGMRIVVPTNVTVEDEVGRRVE